MFKKALITTAATCLMTFSAHAGGLGEPIVEQDIIIDAVEETSSSSGQMLPIILFGLLAVLAKN